MRSATNSIRAVNILKKTRKINVIREKLSPYKRQRKLFRKVVVAKKINSWLLTLEKKYVGFFFKRDIVKCVNRKIRIKKLTARSHFLIS